jgi:hypothetical protein
VGQGEELLAVLWALHPLFLEGWERLEVEGVEWTWRWEEWTFWAGQGEGPAWLKVETV